MNAEASKVLEPQTRIWLLLAIGLVAITFTLLLIKVRHWPQAIRSIAISGMAVIATAAIVGFMWVGLASQQVRPENLRVVSSAAGSATSPVVNVAAENPMISNAESIKSAAARPEWTRQSTHVDGRQKLIVVSSGRFASEQEAELHGYQQAAVIAAKEYSSLDPRGIGAVQPQHADLIKDSAIKRQFPEVTQHDFGKFQAPMHQLWLEVALTPELGERLAEPWRQAAIDARLRMLGGWGLWGTAAAALAAFGLRLDSAWNGKRRAVIGGTVAALALGSLAFLV